MPPVENIADHRYTLSTAAVAALLEVSASTVRLLTDAGRLPCQRTPSGHRRFRRVDVDAYLHDQRRPAGP